MTLVALEVGRYELRPLIELLEERGSRDFFRDAGGISVEVWVHWVEHGLTAEEAITAANHLGLSASEIWENWPDVPTWIASARQSLKDDRQEAS